MSVHQQILRQDKIKQHGLHCYCSPLLSMFLRYCEIPPENRSHQLQRKNDIWIRRKPHVKSTETYKENALLIKEWVKCRTHQHCVCCWSEKEAVRCCSRNLRSAPGAVGIHSRHTQTSDSSKNLTDSSGQQSDAHTHQEKSRTPDSRTLMDLNAIQWLQYIKTTQSLQALCVSLLLAVGGNHFNPERNPFLTQIRYI